MEAPLSAMTNVRPAAVAGAFYPGDPQQLRAEVDELLGSAGSFAPRFGHPKALIVPHAGYVYSGEVAAGAYSELACARGVVRRVVMLGPVHRVPVRGLALPDCGEFATPLGGVKVDRDAVEAARAMRQVVISAPAHAMEHSLEVQLPFLQRVLGEFSLVPFAVGDASVDEVAQVIERLWGGPETLIVLSTDLSHYHGYDEAKRIDGATLERIERLSTDLDHDEACGATPLNGLLSVARSKGLTVRRLAACNSGDTAGGRSRVVGYAAFALEEEPTVSESDAGRSLVAIARAEIASELGLGERPLRDASGWLRQPAATFVTLTKGGGLRGCIGSLAAERPLGEDVAANALRAAFHDLRFPAVTASEWPQVEVEVSLLSAPRPLHFSDEAELLEAIVPGEDGLILEADGKRGTFLPQVWESIPDKRQFVAELKRKAGLPAETRITRCRVSRYRVLKFRQQALH